MKMTLEDAKNCFTKPCNGCKFNEQDEIDCRQEAFSIAESAINYILIGNKLAEEENNKER